MSESKKSNSAKGGKRPGAGRKPSTIKGVARILPKDTSALILAEIKANQRWIDLANSEDERIQLDTLKYLTDRAFGKPKQAIEHSGTNGGPIEVSDARAKLAARLGRAAS